MKIKLKKLQKEQINMLVRRISDYSQYLNFMQQAEARQAHFIYLSILTKLQFEVMKKAMDPGIEKSTRLSLDLHTAFILHSALLYRQEEHPYYQNLQRMTLNELNQQMPRCSDIASDCINSEI